MGFAALHAMKISFYSFRPRTHPPSLQDLSRILLASVSLSARRQRRWHTRPVVHTELYEIAL